jgi:hypothetical protein
MLAVAEVVVVTMAVNMHLVVVAVEMVHQMYKTGIGTFAQNGLANTGGGGGGCGGGDGATSATSYGAAGGSGIVVLRYPAYLSPAASTTGNPTTYIAGAWRVYIFNASGTITF